MQLSDNAKAAYSYGQIANETERARFLVQSILAKANISVPVLIMTVANTGGVSPIGTVTIRPLVQQITGDDTTIDHGDIANVPYMRIQGGANAVILDPQVGDIGIALFCDKDISVVKSTGKASPPGSNRTNHMADAIYLQSIIGAAPTQYVQFTAAGINVVSPTKVTVQAPNLDLDGTTVINGNTTINGNVSTFGTLKNNNVNVGSTHVHPGITRGSGISDPPSPT